MKNSIPNGFNFKANPYIKDGFLILALLSNMVYSFGQKDTTAAKETKPKVEIIARPMQDSVLLRWAPNNSLLWEDANAAGYILERITLLRDGKVLADPERKILTPVPLKPKPLDDWEKTAIQDKYAAIAAQALYGETFEIDDQKGFDFYSVFTKVRERDTRFSFALAAADQSPATAKLSGLYYCDITAKNNEKYLYKVYIAGEAGRKADTGFVYTGTGEYQPLPKPIDLKAEFLDRKVNLSWNHLYFSRIYNAYILERSDDNGKSYHAVTDEPLINLVPEGHPDPQLYYKTDSFPENERIYFYRVRGINSFGEISDASDVVSGMGHASITFTPYFSEYFTVENKKIVLKWEFPSEKVGEINGFKISRASNAKAGFKYIADNLNNNDREFTDEKPVINNYYIISAYNNHGDEVRSAPVLVQLIDSIPPLPPADLRGSIDTNGIVTLCWKKNPEEDIFGYRIYRANYAGEEFSQITIYPTTDSCYTDSIELKTLTKSVFYKVMAIDLRQNHSAFSDALEIKRPNKIPPVSPVFETVQSSAEGVYLSWINSSSEGVKEYLLYRSILNSKEWKLIAVFPVTDSITGYMDKEADSIAYNYYAIIAQFEDGLESEPSTPVQGKKIDLGIRNGVEKIFYEVDREKGNIKLAWKRPVGDVFRYTIYRSKDKDEMTVYTSVPGKDDSFTDEKLQPNTLYQYSIKTIFADGSQSGFSKKTLINY